MTIEDLHDKYEKSWLVKKQVQAELDVSESKLDAMRKSKEIAFFTVGGQIRFNLDEVIRVMKGE